MTENCRCGGEPVLIRSQREDGYGYGIMCRSCGIVTRIFDTEEEAKENWNQVMNTGERVQPIRIMIRMRHQAVVDLDYRCRKCSGMLDKRWDHCPKCGAGLDWRGLRKEE